MAPPVNTAPRRTQDSLVVAAGLLVYALVWVLGYWAVTLSPPVDNAEQVVWARALEWGYYKHPPLPTWLLAAAGLLLPVTPELTYALGAFLHVASMAILWHVLRRLCGAQYAALALLAVLCISLYSGRLYYYNHNVLMMLWVALLVDLSWRLTLRPTLLLWSALGLVTGLGMLTKYQFVLASAVVVLWWFYLRGWSQPVHRWGALLACAVAALVFAPHAYWLATHDWMPLSYAQHSALGHDLLGAQRLAHVFLFVGDWFLNRSLPALLVLGVAAWAWHRGVSPPQALATDRQASMALVHPFLLLWGWVPLVLMGLMCLLGGTKLHLHWGTAFMLWSVPAVMQCWRKGLPWRRAVLPRAAWVAFGVVQALLLLQAWMASPQGLRGYKANHTDFFPSQTVAAYIAAEAATVLGGSVQLVSGPQALAQAIALALPDTPWVLTDGRLERSPGLELQPWQTLRGVEVFDLRSNDAPADARTVLGRWAWRPYSSWAANKYSP